MVETCEFSEIRHQNYICKDCKGKGKKKIRTSYQTYIEIFCPKCNGKGYLDWVENIVGVKKNLNEKLL